MCLQKEVLTQYMQLNQLPTLKYISGDTGIQLTRVFRILHGAEMKLKEFEIFRNKVCHGLGENESLVKVAHDCQESLSPKGIQLLKVELNRLLAIKQLAS